PTRANIPEFSFLRGFENKAASDSSGGSGGPLVRRSRDPPRRSLHRCSEASFAAATLTKQNNRLVKLTKLDDYRDFIPSGQLKSIPSTSLPYVLYSSHCRIPIVPIEIRIRIL
ncbi:hypothetical protein HAX54_037834, partial [Datura stramonium]|nr:hypothetical protein [Datura stramonium]